MAVTQRWGIYSDDKSALALGNTQDLTQAESIEIALNRAVEEFGFTRSRELSSSFTCDDATSGANPHINGVGTGFPGAAPGVLISYPVGRNGIYQEAHSLRGGSWSRVKRQGVWESWVKANDPLVLGGYVANLDTLSERRAIIPNRVVARSLGAPVELGGVIETDIIDNNSAVQVFEPLEGGAWKRSKIDGSWGGWSEGSTSTDRLVVYDGDLTLGEAIPGKMIGVLANADGVLAGNRVESGDVWVFVAKRDGWHGYKAGGSGAAAPVAPGSPSSPRLSVYSVTQDSASVEWSAINGATSYEGRMDGGPIGTVTSPWKISELSPNSSHMAEVRSVGEAGMSAWSAVDFKTLAPKPVGLAWHKATIPGYTFDPSMNVSTTSSADDTVTGVQVPWGRFAQTTLSMPGDGFVEFMAHPATNEAYSIRLGTNISRANEQAYIAFTATRLEANIPGGVGSGFLRTDAPGVVEKYRFVRTPDSTRLDVFENGDWKQLVAGPRMSGSLILKVTGSGTPTDFKVSSLSGVGWS